MTSVTVQKKPEEFQAVQFDGANFNEVKTFLANVDYFSLAVGVIETPDTYAGLGADPILVFKSGSADQGYLLVPEGWWAVYLNDKGWSIGPNLDAFVQVTP